MLIVHVMTEVICLQVRLEMLSRHGGLLFQSLFCFQYSEPFDVVNLIQVNELKDFKCTVHFSLSRLMALNGLTCVVLLRMYSLAHSLTLYPVF